MRGDGGGGGGLGGGVSTHQIISSFTAMCCPCILISDLSVSSVQLHSRVETLSLRTLYQFVNQTSTI